jgi:hypothetical protein
VKVSLCIQPAANEPRQLSRYELTDPYTVLEVPARHLVNRIEHDPATGELALWLDEATERARPVHVRIDIVHEGEEVPPRSHHLGTFVLASDKVDVFGGYLGVVSDEN